jgi:hypothetical protein
MHRVGHTCIIVGVGPPRATHKKSADPHAHTIPNTYSFMTDVAYQPRHGHILCLLVLSLQWVARCRRPSAYFSSPADGGGEACGGKNIVPSVPWCCCLSSDPLSVRTPGAHPGSGRGLEGHNPKVFAWIWATRVSLGAGREGGGGRTMVQGTTGTSDSQLKQNKLETFLKGGSGEDLFGFHIPPLSEPEIVDCGSLKRPFVSKAIPTSGGHTAGTPPAQSGGCWCARG